MKDLLAISDELSTARNFVECAFMACHDLTREHSGPLCAILHAASEKLEAIGEALDVLRASPQTGEQQS